MANDDQITDRNTYGEWAPDQWRNADADLTQVSRKDWGEYTAEDWRRGEKQTKEQQQQQGR